MFIICICVYAHVHEENSKEPRNIILPTKWSTDQTAKTGLQNPF